MSIKEKDLILKPADRDVIFRGDWLTDIHIDHFHQLLAICSDYRPVETWRIQCLHTIQPILPDKKHIQILHSMSNPSDGHWVCSYYDRKNIFIYDSLNNKTMHKHHEQFLKRLFPTYEFEKNPVKFPNVQLQPNFNDCGVFAIAFATSLLFNIKPDKVKYEHKLMRSHLIQMLETNIINHFPQNPQYVVQKVLPLSVLKAKVAEAIRKRMIRQYETEEKKSIRLRKRRDVYNTKKNLNEIQLMVQNATKELHLSPSVSKENQLTPNALIIEIMNQLVNNIDNKENNNNNYFENQDQENVENNCDVQQNAHMKIVNKLVKKTKQNNNNKSFENLNQKNNLENNRAKKRCRYKQELENNRAKKRQRYEQNIEINRAKKRIRYKNDIVSNRAKKRRQYENNLENNRAKKRIRYLKNLQHERDRQKKLNSDRKWLYNKQYYEKKKFKSSIVMENHIVSKNIIRKYEKFWSKSYTKFYNPVIVEHIFNKLDIKN